MKRPLSLVLAAALAAGTIAVGAAPASAQGVGVEFGVGNWNNDRWHYDDNGWRSRDRHRHGDRFAPGFSFNFGVPFSDSRAYYRPRYRDRDCYRDEWGERICRY